MYTFVWKQLLATLTITLCCALVPLQSQAAQNTPSAKSSKEKLVLMPLRVPEEDKNLTGAMETALVKGLQQKYDVYSGEQVAQKAHEIFMKESRNTAHTECDETKCMQNIAMAFQAELIATANVTKQDGNYFLALSIQNIFDNQVVQSESIPCKACDATQVIEKLKDLVGPIAAVALAVPVVAKPAPAKPEVVIQKVVASDPEKDLWEAVAKSNSREDYRAYLNKYPNGKYAPLAQNHLAKFRQEVQVAQAPPRGRPIIKKSANGICHRPGDGSWAKTKRFRPYETMEACLESGGRLPRR
jgi:hypothetical protein